MTSSKIPFWSKNIVTIFGLGYKTKFPGTLASLLALIFSFLSFYFFDKNIYTVLFFIFILLGFWAIQEIQKRVGQEDHAFIVIDEWIGMWLVCFFLFELNSTLIHKILIALLGFIIFRIIDIFKFIPPIDIIDRMESQTASSVILDDIIAGCYSYAILMIIFGFYNLYNVSTSFLILLAPMIANMTPVLLRKIKIFKQPINKEFFGGNKTWRGFIGGIFIGTLFYILFYFISTKTNAVGEASNLSSAIAIGFLLSFGALLGDLIKSYFKRRAGIKMGGSWIPWDQIDYVVGAIVVTYPIYHYTLGQMILMLIIGGTMSALAHRYAYFIKIIDTKS
jgi:CDP-2,3-bis-(O-geranylgeranyl)-sn-glycerol synthase